MSGCNPDTIIRKAGHKHSLVCGHDSYITSDGRIVYLDGDQFEETCDSGHTHEAKLHISETFNRVARSEEEAADIKENYVFIREDGNAELRKPSLPTKKDQQPYHIVGMLMRL